jgi:hypothetical protein
MKLLSPGICAGSETIGVDQLRWMSLRGAVTALISCLSLWRDLLEVGATYLQKKGGPQVPDVTGALSLYDESFAGPALMRSNHL